MFGMGLGEVLVILVIVIPIWLVWRTSTGRRREGGVGGWLLYFCLVLTVGVPLKVVAGLGESYSVAFTRRDPALVGFITILGVFQIGLAAFSIYAGVRLWRVRPGAVATAKRFLLYVFLLGYTGVYGV